MKIALKDFEQMVKNPKHLWTGRDIENFTLRPREAWANWLITAVFRHRSGESITFAEDEKGDGFILDKSTGVYIQTEHVAAMDFGGKVTLPAGEQRVIDAVFHKVKKGAEYAEGKSLVVFFDGAGNFVRSKIREAIYGKHHFNSVFAVGLLTSDDTGYEYIVTEYKDEYGDQSISYRVKINNDFTDWTVVQQTE